MGQFKPMVKMFTDEPSVILKLKKGGKVAAKHHGEHGHMSMHKASGGMMHGAHEAFEAEHGKAPKKPSMAERRKAMNPNMYAKGGKVEKEIHKVEKELKHHEHSKHAHGLKHGGKAHKASGGEIDREETKTTIKGDEKKFENTKVVNGSKHDRAHGTKAIKEGKVGGFKHGGHAKHHKAVGGKVAEGTHNKMNKGRFVEDTVEGNEHDYLETEMHSAKRDKASGTKGIKETNAGGFKHGGHAKKHHKATGGAIPAATEKNMREDYRKGDTYEGGDWEDRPADTSTSGVKNRKTGMVKEANAGGFKHGGHAKKHFATGGNVVDDGRAVAMPKKHLSQPIANSLQSGTFKKGGKVKKFRDGDSVETDSTPSNSSNMRDMSGGAYDNWKRGEKAENEATRNIIPNAIKRGVDAVKSVFTPKPTPTKKRGGKVC